MRRSRPAPRSVRYAYARSNRQKQLGALPVVASLCRQLDLAGIIDRLCPVREVAIVSHGQVIEALVANRLTSPRPMVGIEGWAREWALAEVFGIEADVLNDDRIGRALDAIAPQQEQIAGTVGAQAIARFGLEVSRLHWDMTSISLYGAYQEPEPGFPAPRWGKPKDRRPDLKQVQTGLAVTAQDGVPLWHRAYDGGAGEIAQVVGTMQALLELAGEQRFLLVGDSKLISRGNVIAMNQAQVRFIGPAGKSYLPTSRLSALDREAALPVAYAAERDRGKPAEQRGAYRVLEGEVTLAGKRAADPELRVRCVFVWSSARAQAAASNRAKKLERARGDLERLERGLGGHHYPDAAAVNARLRVIGRQHKVLAYLRTDVGSGPADKPTLTWEFDQEVLDAEAASDGWYGLLTNLEPTEADAAEVLVRYKGQETVERRYGNFKGPLAVAPLFLTSNRRIAALVTVICLALLIFCLVERGVRRAIAPRLTLEGLYHGQAAKPTGRLIFDALAGLRLNPASADGPPTIPQPPPLQATLMDLLDVDPTLPRWAN
jgi:transposase